MFSSFLFSCENSVYQDYRFFSNNEWSISDTSVFNVEINEKGNFNVYIVFKNDVSYPFYNIHIQTKLFDIKSNKIKDLELKEVNLFEPKTGKPYGKGLGGNFEHEFLLYENLDLEKSSYKLNINHYMREDVLYGMQMIGVKVKKSNSVE